jgi:predicted transcriptional regulator of viral defense system
MYTLDIVLRTISRVYMNYYKNRPQTLFESLEGQLAQQHRRVVSDWRTIVLLRKSMQITPESQRRWKAAPNNLAEARALLKRFESSGYLEQYDGHPNLYRVTSPYARQEPIEEDEILMELHPYAAISHLSALAFHHLTNQLPHEIHLTVPTGRSSRILPIGIRKEEWFPDLSALRGRPASSLGDASVQWHQLEKYFGYAEYSPKSYPVRVMTVEKTLIDGLANPEWGGGFANVLEAWANAKDALNLRAVLEFTDRQDVALLKQRVGYVLEELGFSDPSLNEWAAHAKRGGSSRLLGSAAFAPNFSARWKLSLNASTYPLHREG